jgi:hypothetical protein
LFLVEEPKPEKKVILGYVRSKDISKIALSDTFYFHSTDKQNNFIGFPYDLYDADTLVLYTGGRAKPFEILEIYGDIKKISHKNNSEIKGKENSETKKYFEVTLHDNFRTVEKFKKKLDFKKLIAEFKKEYSITKAIFKPILVDKAALFEET